jgi:N-acetylglutamate synthase-like GNAT family acetyltransferase
MTAGGERYVVAERGARLAGYGARRGGELTALFVRPAAARAGVASRLLARIEREARAAGVRTLVTLASRSGVPFYRARGFEGGRAVRVPLPGGLSLGALRLTKRLAR